MALARLLHREIYEDPKSPAGALVANAVVFRISGPQVLQLLRPSMDQVLIGWGFHYFPSLKDENTQQPEAGVQARA